MRFLGKPGGYDEGGNVDYLAQHREFGGSVELSLSDLSELSGNDADHDADDGPHDYADDDADHHPDDDADGYPDLYAAVCSAHGPG